MSTKRKKDTQIEKADNKKQKTNDNDDDVSDIKWIAYNEYTELKRNQGLNVVCKRLLKLSKKGRIKNRSRSRSRTCECTCGHDSARDRSNSNVQYLEDMVIQLRAHILNLKREVSILNYQIENAN